MTLYLEKKALQRHDTIVLIGYVSPLRPFLQYNCLGICFIGCSLVDIILLSWQPKITSVA